MTFEYYAENHDWDLTLRASGNLFMQGQAANNNSQLQFSCLTGAMLLSFSAIESYMMTCPDKLYSFIYSGQCPEAGWARGCVVEGLVWTGL